MDFRTAIERGGSVREDHGVGFNAEQPGELGGAIHEGLKGRGPAIIDCVVAADEMPNVSHFEFERFPMAGLIFLTAFGTLALSFWPDMIPFSIAINEAAAPHASLAFRFWGAGLFVFPLMLVYTAISWSVFGDKVVSASDHP